MLNVFRNLTGENTIVAHSDKKVINLNREGISEYLRSNYVANQLPENLRNVVYLSGRQIDEMLKYSEPMYTYPNTALKHKYDANRGWEHREVVFEAPDFEKGNDKWARYMDERRR